MLQSGYSAWMASHGQSDVVAQKPIGDIAYWASEVKRLTSELRRAAAALADAAAHAKQ